MSPLPLLIVAAVKVLVVVTPPAETWSVCNDSNFTIVSVSIDICARIKSILQPCSLHSEISKDLLKAQPRSRCLPTTYADHEAEFTRPLL